MTNVMQQFFAKCFALNVRVLDMKYNDFNHLGVDGLILYQEVLTSFFTVFHHVSRGQPGFPGQVDPAS